MRETAPASGRVRCPASPTCGMFESHSPGPCPSLTHRHAHADTQRGDCWGRFYSGRPARWPSPALALAPGPLCPTLHPHRLPEGVTSCCAVLRPRGGHAQVPRRVAGSQHSWGRVLVTQGHRFSLRFCHMCPGPGLEPSPAPIRPRWPAWRSGWGAGPRCSQLTWAAGCPPPEAPGPRRRHRPESSLRGGGQQAAIPSALLG